MIVVLTRVRVSFAQVRVSLYIGGDDTLVQPHYRSRSDLPVRSTGSLGHCATAGGNIWNNYSPKGNVNPYADQKGYVRSLPAAVQPLWGILMDIRVDL